MSKKDKKIKKQEDKDLKKSSGGQSIIGGGSTNAADASIGHNIYSPKQK